MSISANIESAKTIRDYLGSINDPTQTVTIKMNDKTTLENVDLTWDGQNYYILSTTTATTEDGGNIITTTTTNVYKLDEVLPLNIVSVKTTPKASE